MEEFELTNEKKITQKEWKEFLSFREEYQENEAKRNLLLQRQNDILEGGIRSSNLKEYRNTYVINAQDSLDDTYDMLVHFNIISEMTKIVSIKLSFWISPFRAYSTSATEKEAVTSGASSAESSASGGADTTGATGSASGGAGTSGVVGDIMGIRAEIRVHDVGGTNSVFVPAEEGDWFVLAYESGLATHTHSTPDHTHPNHTHSTPDHTHDIPHTHSIPAHSHNITYGIFEEETSPTIQVYISRDNGKTYSLPVGSYTEDQENLDITRFIDTKGSKIIKFESTTRARLSVQVTIKLDIKAR